MAVLHPASRDPHTSTHWSTCVPKCFRSVQLFVTLWTVAYQAPLSRQAYWSGLPCLPSGDLPDPGIEPMSPAAPALQADSLPLSHRGSPGEAPPTEVTQQDFYCHSAFLYPMTVASIFKNLSTELTIIQKKKKKTSYFLFIICLVEF